MERLKLRAARGCLSLKEVADAVGCSPDALRNWEKGTAKPQWYLRNQLCAYYKLDPAELDLEGVSSSREDERAMVQLKLEMFDRREIIEMLSVLPAFAGINLSLLLEPHAVAPEDFLDQCNAGISACWHLLKHDGLAHADNILSACMPKLADLAGYESPYQQIAASLAAEAKIQQVILSGHKLDYRSREIHSLAAMRFGNSSGDGRILATAISWHADLYTSSWSRSIQPKKAIDLFKEGLANLDENAPLNRADLSIGLAKAYALNREQTKALDMIEQARVAMPAHPEDDPFFRIIELGPMELGQQEGRVYLELDRLFPRQGYAQRAYKTFDQGLNNQSVADRHQSQILIQKAEAARAIGDLSHFAECLSSGLEIAFQIGSAKRQKEAKRILGKVPTNWQKEHQYQSLVKLF